MEDREILACMRSLIAEEHWVKSRRSHLAATGAAENVLAELDTRAHEVSVNLRTLCDELRSNHAAAAAAVVVDLTEGARSKTA